MTPSEQLNGLVTRVARILNAGNVSIDTPLNELGFDSLNVVELIIACQEVYPNVIDPGSIQFDEHTTLREIDEQLQVPA
jgi:acyl carrier protein